MGLNVYCIICNVDLSSKNYNRHYKSKKHFEKRELKCIEINVLKDIKPYNLTM